MLDSFKKIKDILTPRQQQYSLLLFGMMIIMGLLDVVSISLIFPFMDLLSNPESIEQKWYLNNLFQWLKFNNHHDFLIFSAILLLFGIIISIIFRAITILAFMRFSHTSTFELAKRVLCGYLHQPYEWFLDRHSADLGKTLLSEVNHVINTSLVQALYFVSRIVLAIFLICLLMVVNPVIALTSGLGLGAVYACISFIIRKYAHYNSARRMQANKEQFQIAQETLAGIKDVKIFGLEQIMVDRFSKPALFYARSNANMVTITQTPRFALEAIAFGGMLLIILIMLNTRSEAESVIPIITLFAFTAYRLLPAMQGIYQNYSMMRYGKNALDVLHRDLMHLEKRIDKDDETMVTGPECYPLGSVLELRNIHYRYPGTQTETLKDLSLKISANTTIALVGGSGAGKTTVADIILGLLIPQSGELIVDGEIISRDKVRSWQQSIGYVPQNIFLMDDTIAANIAFGISRPQQDIAAIKYAAKAAGLDQFISNELPDEYQTMVGEGGVKLSGGQRQRIGIARALYRNPDVLIMDEATNALDNLTEQAVMDAIYNLSRTRTIILIAHRLSTVKNCDQIFFIDSGCLKDQGTFQELMENNREFAQLTSAGRRE